MPEGQERLRKIPPHDLPGSGPNHRYLMGLRQAVASCGGLWGGGWCGLWGPVAGCGGLWRAVAACGDGWRRTAPPIIPSNRGIEYLRY